MEHMDLKLIDIAAGATQRQCFNFLLLFGEVKVRPETMGQAITSGDETIFRDVWKRLDAGTRTKHLAYLATNAVAFHREDVLVAGTGSDSNELKGPAGYAIKRRNAPGFLFLMEVGVGSG